MAALRVRVTLNDGDLVERGQHAEMVFNSRATLSGPFRASSSAQERKTAHSARVFQP
jgi:hypothetical protein